MDAGISDWVRRRAARRQTVSDLRRRVRKELVGPATCTHLNDTLRELADLDTLAAALIERVVA